MDFIVVISGLKKMDIFFIKEEVKSYNIEYLFLKLNVFFFFISMNCVSVELELEMYIEKIGKFGDKMKMKML